MNDSRLRWRCRRGMREIDELLIGYFDRGYLHAGEAEKSAFRRLLELPDAELIDYLLGGIDPADQELQHVIRRIRSGTRAE